MSTRGLSYTRVMLGLTVILLISLTFIYLSEVNKQRDLLTEGADEDIYETTEKYWEDYEPVDTTLITYDEDLAVSFHNKVISYDNGNISYEDYRAEVIEHLNKVNVINRIVGMSYPIQVQTPWDYKYKIYFTQDEELFTLYCISLLTNEVDVIDVDGRLQDYYYDTKKENLNISIWKDGNTTDEIISFY